MPGQLRNKITAPNLTLFDARANYKKILLVDWDSTEDDLNLTTNSLRILKDTIYKWDQQVHRLSYNSFDVNIPLSIAIIRNQSIFFQLIGF